MNLSGARIHISGIVQGVGFRPFVYALANRFELKGWVRNTSAGVDIEVDGTRAALESFISALEKEAPPLAHIDEVSFEYQPAHNFEGFEIVHSQPIENAFQPISPDVSICQDCLSELLDPNDRRYLYPFINCTNCGPRFTIIADIPYDRPNTTMAAFKMCPECAAEYNNPLDRRFHAQPIACPVCGPHVWLEDSNLRNKIISEKTPAIIETQRLLKEGKVVAIKGLGGFHLACDALNKDAVAELRRRKLRVDKPFALMMPDIATIEEHCYVDAAERQLLESRQRPIVILRRKPQSSISNLVAPGQDTIGVMLPYTPLHHLIFESGIEDSPSSAPPSSVLVMTSGNLSEEPIAIDNDEARLRLNKLADFFLMHNRPIRTRCDDSVMRIFHVPNHSDVAMRNKTALDTAPIRRSRGYSPFPVHLPWQVIPLLATGTEMKNAFCITRDRYAFLSHHIGDMENYETLHSFEDGIQHFERLFRIVPQAIAFDLHPDYLATRYAQERAKRQGLPSVGVQHHHAHIAACMVENGIPKDQPTIGVSFDGTGYGEDGAIWGGEFLIANYHDYQRPYHLSYAPLPGGDQAVREPWRMALTWLSKAGLSWKENLPPMAYVIQEIQNPDQHLDVLKHQIRTGLNAPQTSSVGRLFDAVASLVGVRACVNYEAQAAIELESLVDPNETGFYPFDLNERSDDPQIDTTAEFDPSPMVRSIVSDLENSLPLPVISARFHNSLARLVLHICRILREQYNIHSVTLSGGVWQNITLLHKTSELLINDCFELYIHRQVPTNDGGLALGQAAIAANRLEMSLM